MRELKLEVSGHCFLVLCNATAAIDKPGLTCVLSGAHVGTGKMQAAPGAACPYGQDGES